MVEVPDFNITKDKIGKLLEELRSWEPGEANRTLTELAEMFELDLFVVDRVAVSEGHHLQAGILLGPPRNSIDPNAATIDLDPEAVHDVLKEPDPNPAWKERDEDTGVWRKKPTGEWERIDRAIRELSDSSDESDSSDD